MLGKRTANNCSRCDPIAITSRRYSSGENVTIWLINFSVHEKRHLFSLGKRLPMDDFQWVPSIVGSRIPIREESFLTANMQVYLTERSIREAL